MDEDGNATGYSYGTYMKDGTERHIYNLFTTHDTAFSMADGKKVEIANANNKPALMTVSVESHSTQESSYSALTNSSYVVAMGTTDFTSQQLMESNAYGNTDLLLSTLRTVGQEPVPVGIGFKAFADKTIDTITTAEATQYTVILTVIPPVLALAAGIFVIVRRKNR